MSTRRLAEQLQPLADALRPVERIQQDRASRVVINPDNTVNPDALVDVLPWQRVRWRVDGNVTNGSTIDGPHPMPQGCIVRLGDIRAGTAPSTGGCTFVLRAGGESVRISLPKGQTVYVTPGINIVVSPGGVLTIDNTSAAGAADVTVTVFYSPYPGGS